ncbi:MAG: CBS domain-containing protein [Aestuariibacter sp.]|nr:CBS domain-containing protein [Aestuariibacter sp.]
MKPPAGRITTNLISEALAQMRKQPGDYGYYIDKDGYQGVVSQRKLEIASDSGTGRDTICTKVIEKIPAVSPSSLLEEVLPETLDAKYPLPVVDEQGKLRGELSRASLAQALVETGNTENDVTDTAA